MFLRDNKGISMVYVMISLIIIGLTATALIKLSHKNAITQINYSNSESARLAVLSGFDRALAFFESDDTTAILEILNTWHNEKELSKISDKYRWIIGGPTAYDSIYSDCKFKVQVLGFDTANYAISLHSEGMTRAGHKASAVGTYYLDGLGYDEIESNKFDNENAIYLGDGISFTLRGPMYVSGNSYFGVGVNFGQHCSGTVFDGVFRTGKSNSVSIDMKGTYTFNKPAYFGMKHTTDGQATFTFKDKVGFEHGMYWKGSQNKATTEKTSYWNYRPTGPYNGLGTLDMKNQTAFYNGNFYLPGRINTINHNLHKEYYKMDIEDSLFGDNIAVCEINVNIDAIDDEYIHSWDDIMDAHGISDYEMSGSLANTICDSIVNKAKKGWHGFAVVEQDEQMLLSNAGNTKFSQKMILLCSDDSPLRPTSDAKVFSTTPTANFSIFAIDDGEVQNIGGWDYFRSFMFCDSTSTFVVGGNGNQTSNVHGAIHAQGGATVEWYPLYTTQGFVKYDKTVLQELSKDGFLKLSDNCDTGTEVETDSTTLIFKQANLVAELLSRSF